MVIHNTTFIIHADIEDDVIQWIRNSYAASAAKLGAVGIPMLSRVISPMMMEGDENSYALHLSFPSMEMAKKWSEGVGASLRGIMNGRWGDKSLALPTYLEVIE